MERKTASKIGKRIAKKYNVNTQAASLCYDENFAQKSQQYKTRSMHKRHG